MANKYQSTKSGRQIDRAVEITEKIPSQIEVILNEIKILQENQIDKDLIPQKLSDLINDITDQTYNSSSEKPQSGKAVAEAIANLLGTAPENLDTLEELAKALNEDENFAAKVIAELTNKADKVDGKGLSTNDFTDGLKKRVEENTFDGYIRNPEDNPEIDYDQYTTSGIYKVYSDYGDEQYSSILIVKHYFDGSAEQIETDGEYAFKRVKDENGKWTEWQKIYVSQTDLDKAIGDVEASINKNKQNISDISQLFELENGKNILMPDSESGYYDTSTLAKMASAKHIRTPNPIPLDASRSTLFVRTNVPSGTSNISSAIVCIIYIDNNGNSISSESFNMGDIISYGILNGTIPTAATHILVWISNVKNVGYDLSNICLSYSKITEFEPYSEEVKITIKNEALNKAAVPFEGKVIVNFGDSIFGNRRPPSDISTQIAELTGATVYNCGFGGCRMAQHTGNWDAFSMYRLAYSIANNDWTLQDTAISATWSDKPNYFNDTLTLLKSIDFSKVDIITIAYGTNDFTGDIHLENSDNNKDVSRFAGALRYSIETLLSAYPHLKIFVCSQTYRFWIVDGAFSEDSDTHENERGAKLTDFVAKTKEVAEEYHIPYIDNYNIGMNKYNRSFYFSATDGTHPLPKGDNLMAAHIVKELF